MLIADTIFLTGPGIIGCLSGALLASVTTTSLLLVDALYALGLGGLAARLWQCLQFRKLIAGGVGVAVGSLFALADFIADILCGECPCNTPSQALTL